MPPPTAESANAALCACSRPSAVAMRSSHSSSGMNGTFSLNAGRGIAHVQCAPCPPTLVAAAAAGKRRRVRRALAAEVEEVRALAGGEHALDDGARRDAERLAELPGLRPLRPLARPRLLDGVGDVAHALAGTLGQLRACLEHDDTGIRNALEQQPGVGGADRPAADDGDRGVVRHGVLLFEAHAVRGSDAGSGGRLVLVGQPALRAAGPRRRCRPRR